MTISTNYGDLLKRQAWLQQAGAAHLGACGPAQVTVALLAEIGELAQELKPEWAWWRKSEDAEQVDRDKVLGEAADVLHFALLFDLVVKRRFVGGAWGEIEVWSDWASKNSTVADLVDDMRAHISMSAAGLGIALALCTLVARYGFTPHDLAAAYWAKTEVNLKRWGAA